MSNNVGTPRKAYSPKLVEGVFSEVRGAAGVKITHLGHAPGFTSGIQYLRYVSEVEGSIPWRRKRTRRSSSLRTRAPTFPSWTWLTRFHRRASAARLRSWSGAFLPA